MRVVVVADDDDAGLDRDPWRRLADRRHAVRFLTPRRLGEAGGGVLGTVAVRTPAPATVRDLRLVGWLIRHAGEYDVVVATRRRAAAIVGAHLAARPVAVTPEGPQPDHRVEPGASSSLDHVVHRAAELLRRGAAGIRRAILRTADEMLPGAWSGAGGRGPEDPTVATTPDELEAALVRAVRGRPRAILLGATQAETDDRALERRIEILTRHIRATFVAEGPAAFRHIGSARLISLPRRPAGVRPGLTDAAWAVLAVGMSAGRRRTAVVCAGPRDAICTVALARLLPARVRPRVAVELHRDWRSVADPDASTEDHRSPMLDRIAAAALVRADLVRVVDDRTARLARELGWRGEVDRFPAFSTYDRFLSTPPSPLPEAPRVLFVGALEQANGVDVLLEAWEEVRRRRPDAVLAVVGRGSLEREVRDRAAVMGSGTVRLVGAVGRDEVKDLLDRAQVVVAPSRSAGVGRVVVEAFARGRAVVGSGIDILPGLVLEGDRGLLVPEGDPAALAAGILRLLDDPAAAAAMGRRAREGVERMDPAAEYEAGIGRLARWIDGRRPRSPADAGPKGVRE